MQIESPASTTGANVPPAVYPPVDAEYWVRAGSLLGRRTARFAVSVVAESVMTLSLVMPG